MCSIKSNPVAQLAHVGVGLYVHRREKPNRTAGGPEFGTTTETATANGRRSVVMRRWCCYSTVYGDFSIVAPYK